MKIYRTKQKNLVLECLKQHENENLSAESIIGFLKESGETIGDATVYRHLKKLIEKGNIRKILNKNGVYTYRYFRDDLDCRNHFHLVCQECGKMIHLECKNLKSLYQHIAEEHNFNVDTVKTVFYGKCSECSKK